MSEYDYSALTTDRLLEIFVDAAKEFRLGREQLARLQRLRDPLAPAPGDDLDDRKPAAAQLQQVSEVLYERLPIVDVERLMGDDDPDIRMTAAALLGDLSPEWADAAAKGAQAMLPTRRVLALQRRARVPPPERPTLEEMSDDELVNRFEDAALRESGTHFLDYLEDPSVKDLQNDIVGEVSDIMRQLKSRGLLARLLPLLASDNLTVRREAATACLRIAEPEAISALESVSRNGIYGEGFAARGALGRWRKDGTIVYGV
jgi:hypothetical protein